MSIKKGISNLVNAARSSLEEMTILATSAVAGYSSRHYFRNEVASLIGTDTRVYGEHFLWAGCATLGGYTLGRYIENLINEATGDVEKSGMPYALMAVSTFIALAYDLNWESTQAASRGFFQTDQMMAELLGVSVVLAYVAIKNKITPKKIINNIRNSSLYES